MRLAEEGSLMEEYELAPGVVGYAMQDGDVICVSWMMAEREGSGDVGRFLDSLAASPLRFCVPNVISLRLAGMLERRGWRPEQHYVEELGEYVDRWFPHA